MSRTLHSSSTVSTPPDHRYATWETDDPALVNDPDSKIPYSNSNLHIRILSNQSHSTTAYNPTGYHPRAPRAHGARDGSGHQTTSRRSADDPDLGI